MTQITLYHNPRCSKSRQTLALLEEYHIHPEIRLYLDQPPSPGELKSVLDKLGIKARALLRKSEEAYRELGLDNMNMNEAALIQAMCSTPKLIERPIAITQERAIIGRPPEAVLELLS